jgi:hypothetical protein
MEVEEEGLRGRGAARERGWEGEGKREAGSGTRERHGCGTAANERALRFAFLRFAFSSAAQSGFDPKCYNTLQGQIEGSYPTAIPLQSVWNPQIKCRFPLASCYARFLPASRPHSLIDLPKPPIC